MVVSGSDLESSSVPGFLCNVIKFSKVPECCQLSEAGLRLINASDWRLECGVLLVISQRRGMFEQYYRVNTKD